MKFKSERAIDDGWLVSIDNYPHFPGLYACIHFVPHFFKRRDVFAWVQIRIGRFEWFDWVHNPFNSYTGNSPGILYRLARKIDRRG
jgi:hypothetical protein